MKRTAEEVLTEWLVMRTQDGEASAWRQLVERWQTPLYRHARRLSGRHEAARDITQETWLAIWRGIHRLEDPARFRAWAFRIVSNKAADWTRRQQRRRKALASAQAEQSEERRDGQPSSNGSPTDAPVSALRQAIRQLPADRQALISMFYVDDLPLAEMAHILGIPVGTVKSRLHSTRQELKTILERNHE